MDQLPSESLLHIYLKINSHQDLVNLILVNKRTAEISNYELVWKLYFTLLRKHLFTPGYRDKYKKKPCHSPYWTDISDNFDPAQPNCKQRFKELKLEWSNCVIHLHFLSQCAYTYSRDTYIFISPTMCLHINMKNEYTRDPISQTLQDTVITEYDWIQTDEQLPEHYVVTDPENRTNPFQFGSVYKVIIEALENSVDLIYSRNELGILAIAITHRYIKEASHDFEFGPTYMRSRLQRISVTSLLNQSHPDEEKVKIRSLLN